MSSVAIRNAFLHLTKACNLACDYCYFSARSRLPGEMSTSEWARVWPDLVAVGPTKAIFTGGEPLLRDDLIDLLGGLRDADPEHRVERCLNTNGRLVTDAFAEELRGLADEVRVSIDGLPARNDAHRGAGSFEAAVRALERLSAAGLRTKVLVTVTSTTLPDLEELVCFLLERRFTRINLNAFRPIGRGRHHADWSVDPEAMRSAVHRAWRRTYPGHNPPPGPPPHGPCVNCGVGSFLNVMPNGDVFPCHVLTQPEFRCGSVRDEPLVDICRRSGLLGRLQALDFRDLAREDPDVAAVTRPRACMGVVYGGTRDRAVWGAKLPLAPRRRARG